ncbi:hypothetical protein RCL_jg2511.t1 [Rhizophagus clarus]|uniref:Uncharacterized protein n=1 Tax=Rhizophagus clarus TaxID=94130 RepID=A0A8H3LKK0_9GLOM|nr:hypothetical protein RCL_jg2511.t1 [Rhizophagus clarus]
MKDDIIFDRDWDSFIKTIDELSDNTANKHIHQIMDQQMEVSNKTFSLMETVINDLKPMERELNKSEWYEAKNALFEKRVLRNQSLELNERDDDKSNKAFHDDEKNIEQAKTLLKEQFSDDL